MKFYQTRSNAIILHDTLPAYCIPKIIMESGEVIFEKVFASQKLLEVVKTPNKSNQNQKNHYQERRDPWVDKNPPTRTSSTQQEGRDPWMDRNPSKVACRWLFKTEEEDQTRTVRPVGGQESTNVEENEIDFRVPRLSHSVVKEAEHFRVQELFKKIEKSSSSRSTASRLAAE